MEHGLQDQGEVAAFRVYGDNLSECLKFCDMLAEHGTEFGLELTDKVGPIDVPVYLFEILGEQIGLIPCGRYADWPDERRPTIGKEDSDIILCHAEEASSVGEPILGIEFNDAISAGNQDWQRFPRIAQAAVRNVPYLYTVNIASAEVTEGEIKGFRSPNAIIQVAQLALMARYNSLSLTVYSNSPWYGQAIEDGTVSPETKAENWEERVAEVAISTIIDALSDELSGEAALEASRVADSTFTTAFTDAMSRMLTAMEAYVPDDFTILEDHPIIRDNSDKVAQAWLQTVRDGADLPERYRFYEWDMDDFTESPQRFTKGLSTSSLYRDKLNPKLKITKSLRKDELESFAKSWSIDDVTTELLKDEMLEQLYSSSNAEKVPISYKNGDNEIAVIGNKSRFCELVEEVYSPDPTVLNKIKEEKGPIFLLPIAGYVMDTGGPAFSRPDKGFVRLQHELFGKGGNFGTIVTILYSELIPENWVEKLRRAQNEADLKTSNTNNLWRELASFSDVIISGKYAEEDGARVGVVV